MLEWRMPPNVLLSNLENLTLHRADTVSNVGSLEF